MEFQTGTGDGDIEPQLLKQAVNQRFENWKLRRAPALPYFLRSLRRESRVMSLLLRNTSSYSALNLTKKY